MRSGRVESLGILEQDRMNAIFIHDLRVETKIGVYEWERHLPQTIRIDLEIGLPSARPFTSGDFADAVDYAAVVERIKVLAANNPHPLMERFTSAPIKRCTNRAWNPNGSPAYRSVRSTPAFWRATLQPIASPNSRACGTRYRAPRASISGRASTASSDAFTMQRATSKRS